MELGRAGRRGLGGGKQSETLRNLKRGCQGGQNPNCLQLKRLFQNPKYLILLTRVRNKTMEKGQQTGMIGKMMMLSQ